MVNVIYKFLISLNKQIKMNTNINTFNNWALDDRDESMAKGHYKPVMSMIEFSKSISSHLAPISSFVLTNSITTNFSATLVTKWSSLFFSSNSSRFMFCQI